MSIFALVYCVARTKILYAQARKIVIVRRSSTGGIRTYDPQLSPAEKLRVCRYGSKLINELVLIRTLS